MDERTLIFYEPVTWGYFSPMQNNKILDMLLVNAMDSSSIFAIEDILTKICGPMDPNVTEKMPKSLDLTFKNPQISVLATGFNHVPGGPEYNNRSVLSWHYYCNLFDSEIDNNTIQSVFIQIFCDTIFGPDVFNTVKVHFSYYHIKIWTGGRAVSH